MEHSNRPHVSNRKLYRSVTALLMLCVALSLVGLSAADGQRRRRRRTPPKPKSRVSPDLATETYPACGTKVRASEVLIKFKRALSVEQLGTFVTNLAPDKVNRVKRVGTGSTLYLVHIEGMTVSAIMNAFNLAKANRLVMADGSELDFEYVEPNFIFHQEATPDDTDFSSQWALQDRFRGSIKAESAWNTSTDSGNVLIGVVDTGIAYSHPDLSLNVWHATRDFDIPIGNPAIRCHVGDHGFDAFTNSCDPLDCQTHGTEVSGVLGARGNNRYDIAGVNWTTGIVGLKTMDKNGDGPEVYKVNAISFAIEFNKQDDPRKIRVLNNSYGYVTSNDERCRPRALEQAIRDADAAGILFVASAGNDNNDNDAQPHYPSGLGVQNIISVTGTTPRNALGTGFNHGTTSVDIGAPGVNIYTTSGPAGTADLGGTSLAAAFVSGSAALILSVCPGLTPVQVKSCILNNADVTDTLRPYIAHGRRLNLARAVEACKRRP